MEIIGSHSANWICDWLQHYGRLPYFPNVVHSGFHLFGPHMKSMNCKQFAADADTKPTSGTWLHTLGSDFLYAGIQA